MNSTYTALMMAFVTANTWAAGALPLFQVFGISVTIIVGIIAIYKFFKGE